MPTDMFDATALLAVRKALDLTQTEFGRETGISLRTIQELENGSTPVRLRHQLAAERVALKIAAARGDPMLAPASVRNDALRMMQAFAGRSWE